jgi:hypothetical protein
VTTTWDKHGKLVEDNRDPEPVKKPRFVYLEVKPVEGIKVYGPFKNQDLAQEYAEHNDLASGWVLELTRPGGMWKD